MPWKPNVDVTPLASATTAAAEEEQKSDHESISEPPTVPKAEYDELEEESNLLADLVGF